MGFDRLVEARILPTNLLVYSLRGMPRAPKKGDALLVEITSRKFIGSPVKV